MKTQLLKSMPHVPLQKLKPEHQELNRQHGDGIIKDPNAEGGQDDNEVPVNVAENIETAEGTAATFQYIQHNVLNNAEDLRATSGITELFEDVFRKLGARQRNKHGESSENPVQLTSYGNNENSESDSEEDFQDVIPLVRRTQRI